MGKPRRVAVSDSTPLIYLAKIGRLGLVKDVFGKVFIPEAVFNEAVVQGKALNISDAYIIEGFVGAWIITERVGPEVEEEYRFLDTNLKLGPGEKEALKLCKQLNADCFIADDREARRVSKILNVSPIGTCGIIAQSCKQGSITRVETIQIVDDLVKAGFRLDPIVYRRILDELGLSI